MNKEKLNGLELHGGIHTLSVKGNYTANINYEGVTVLKDSIDRSTGEVSTVVKINPNSFTFGDMNYIEYLKDYRQSMGAIKRLCFKTSPTILRVDFRVDNYSGNYTEFLKMNKIVIIILSDLLNLGQIWQSESPINAQTKTLRAQSKYYEVEYYDRYDKTQKEGVTRSRLELRTKQLNAKNKDIPALINEWCANLKNIPEYYEKLQDRYNESLVKIWEEERRTSPTAAIFDFVKKYQENICTPAQLKKLLSAIGANNPRQLAYEYRYKADIEMISQNELKQYIRKVIKALVTFRGRM